MGRTLVITLLVLLTAVVTADAATVSAMVDRDQATVGESINLQVTIEGGDGEVDLSKLTDFKTISRGSTSSFQMINGRTSRQLIYNYVLIPLKAGSLTISAIPVIIDGKAHHTTPIRITVSQDPPADSGQRDVYVTATVSTASPWIGQQVIYTFRLFNAVQVADAKFQAPEFTGFHAEEVKDRKSYRTVINGREFIVTEVIFILVPVKTGPQTIEPAVLQVGLVQRSRRPRPFAGMDAFFGRTEMTTRMLQSDPVTVTVRDLPTRPPGTVFSGLVGRFDLSAVLDKTDLQVGDSTTLAVTVSGRGNIMDAAAPAIATPVDFKTYADNPEETIQNDADGTTGSKTFRTALVPVKAGHFRIDPVRLTYFDVDQGDYRTLISSALAIRVSPSEAATADIDVFRAAPDQMPRLKNRVEFTGRDILPLKEGLEALKTRHQMSPLLFGVLMVLPVLGFAVTCAAIRLTRRDDSPGRIMAERARQALKTASAGDTSDADFLSALYRALVSAILGRRGVTGAALTWTEARTRLIEIGWEMEDADAAARLLEEIESFNYSGSTLDIAKRADLLDQTRQTVRRLAQ
ncbi:BatD family protein [Desulfosarcina sp.]|uniref:BatD family protein n=1 Tax=Desulfosarcina sp. TaxID=2027861 RepID=UPI00397068C2